MTKKKTETAKKSVKQAPAKVAVKKAEPKKKEVVRSGAGCWGDLKEHWRLVRSGYG